MKKVEKTKEQLDAIKSSWYLDDLGVIRWNRNTYRGKKLHDLVGLSVFKSGHRCVFLTINKKMFGFTESNVAWFFYHNEWPLHEVDHIDGNPQNNLKENLRKATRSEQCQNRIAGKHNRKNKGVYKRNYGDRWSAQIWLNGVCKNLGTFSSEEEAIKVRELATINMHKEFANIKSYQTEVSI